MKERLIRIQPRAAGIRWLQLLDGLTIVINPSTCLQVLSERMDHRNSRRSTNGDTSHPVHSRGIWIGRNFSKVSVLCPVQNYGQAGGSLVITGSVISDTFRL